MHFNPAEHPRLSATQPADVCLVNMPYAQIMRPSIALGILKSPPPRAGISAHVEYANFRFVEAVGLEVNGIMSFMRTDSLLGEWTFSQAAFRTGHDTLDQVLGRARSTQPSNLPSVAANDHEFRRMLAQIQEFSSSFVDDIAERVLARQPKVVGCSSTFEQHCPSLALLRRIKELAPEVITVLGGANCEGDMAWATLRVAPWLDYAVSGEADELFAPFCRLMLNSGLATPLEALPLGVVSQKHLALGREKAFVCGKLPRAVVTNMNASPAPDFAEYFELLEQSPLAPFVTAALPVESSRGCWWGQKSHCTFCGLNGAGMNYRSKGADLVLEEWEQLVAAYPSRKISVTDNIIDMGYVKTMLPRLTDMGRPYEIFYETKANLRREHVIAMMDAGITMIQPGIESLHDDLLKLMAKGNSAMINTQLLKYTREVGMATTWLLLVGFPGEDEDWHREVAAWLPLIFHLQPPNGVVTVRYDRFSVYFNEQQKYGLNLRPFTAYEAVYPLPPEDLKDIAYFFYDANAKDRHVPKASFVELGTQVSHWKNAFFREYPAVFCVTDRGDVLDFYDTRPCAPERRVRIDGLAREIYLVCDPSKGEADILKRFATGEPGAPSADLVKEILDDLSARKLMLHLNDKYLSLACFGNIPAVPKQQDFPVGYVNRYDPSRFRDLREAWEFVKSDAFELPPALPASIGA